MQARHSWTDHSKGPGPGESSFGQLPLSSLGVLRARTRGHSSAIWPAPQLQGCRHCKNLGRCGVYGTMKEDEQGDEHISIGGCMNEFIAMRSSVNPCDALLMTTRAHAARGVGIDCRFYWCGSSEQVMKACHKGSLFCLSPKPLAKKSKKRRGMCGCRMAVLSSAAPLLPSPVLPPTFPNHPSPVPAPHPAQRVQCCVHDASMASDSHRAGLQLHVHAPAWHAASPPALIPRSSCHCSAFSPAYLRPSPLPLPCGKVLWQATAFLFMQPWVCVGTYRVIGTRQARWS